MINKRRPPWWHASLRKRKAQAYANANAFVLQHHVQRFQAIFNGVFESIELLKPDDNRIGVNLTAVKLTGIKPERAIDTSLFDRVMAPYM